MPVEPLVRAGGGVVIRDGRVLLVHRPRYDDWSLPKGKLEPGESWQTAALREVEEETGLRCELGEEVGRAHYVDRAGRDKEVRYYLMSSDGEAVAQNEVDEVRWVALEDAAALLTYERDGELLAASSLQHAAAATAESKEEVPRVVPRTIRREMA